MSFHTLLHLQSGRIELYRLGKAHRLHLRTFTDDPSGRAECCHHLNQAETRDILVLTSTFPEHCLSDSWPQLRHGERKAWITRRCTQHFGETGWVRTTQFTPTGKSTGQRLLMQGLPGHQDLDWLTNDLKSIVAITTPTLLLAKYSGDTDPGAIPQLLYYCDAQTLHQILVYAGEPCFIRHSPLPPTSNEFLQHWIEQENHALRDYLLTQSWIPAGHSAPIVSRETSIYENIDSHCLDLITRGKDIPCLRTLKGHTRFRFNQRHRWLQYILLVAATQLMAYSLFQWQTAEALAAEPLPNSNLQPTGQPVALHGIEQHEITALATQIRALPEARQPGTDLNLVSNALEQCPALTLEYLKWETRDDHVKTRIEATLGREHSLSHAEAQICFDQFLAGLNVDRKIELKVEKTPFDAQRGVLSSQASLFQSTTISIELKRSL